MTKRAPYFSRIFAVFVRQRDASAAGRSLMTALSRASGLQFPWQPDTQGNAENQLVARFNQFERIL
jgi:hypothetical protein